MRGKAFRTKKFFSVLGITPAYAGKRTSDAVCSMRCWDHPRLCGEKGVYLASVLYRVGSPPPMRGKVPQKAFV